MLTPEVVVNEMPCETMKVSPVCDVEALDYSYGRFAWQHREEQQCVDQSTSQEEEEEVVDSERVA